MAAIVNRWVVRTVLVCTALAGLAAYHNHVTQPCAANEAGAVGMCVSTSWAGGAR